MVNENSTTSQYFTPVHAHTHTRARADVLILMPVHTYTYTYTYRVASSFSNLTDTNLRKPQLPF